MWLSDIIEKLRESCHLRREEHPLMKKKSLAFISSGYGYSTAVFF
jgi:hypothetical protein